MRQLAVFGPLQQEMIGHFETEFFERGGGGEFGEERAGVGRGVGCLFRVPGREASVAEEAEPARGFEVLVAGDGVTFAGFGGEDQAPGSI